MWHSIAMRLGQTFVCGLVVAVSALAGAASPAAADPATSQYADPFPTAKGSTTSSRVGEDTVSAGSSGEQRAPGASDEDVLLALVAATAPRRSPKAGRNADRDVEKPSSAPGGKGVPAAPAVSAVSAATGGAGGTGLLFPLLLVTVVGAMAFAALAKRHQ